MKKYNKYNLSVKAAFEGMEDELPPHYAFVHLFPDGSSRATNGCIYFAVDKAPDYEEPNIEKPIPIYPDGNPMRDFPKKLPQSETPVEKTIYINLEVLERMVNFIRKAHGRRNKYRENLATITMKIHETPNDAIEFDAGLTPEGQRIWGLIMQVRVALDEYHAGRK